MNELHLFLQTLSRFLGKITSGRFILTIMAGVGLLMMEKAIIDVLIMKVAEEGSISATEILAFASTIFVVIQSVFMSYFHIKRENGEMDFQKDPSQPE